MDHKFNVQAKITKDFKFSVGMEFSSLQQFKDVAREHNLLNGRKIKFPKNDKLRVRAVCKFNQTCGYNVYVSIVKKRTKTFRVRTLCPNHTCEMVFATQELPMQGSSIAGSEKRGRTKGNTLSNVKPNEQTKRKTKGLNVCYKKKERLVDGEPINQNQEGSADGDMMAKNTFVEPISAVNLVPTTADPNTVPSYEKKRKKKVTRKLDLKMVRRTSNRLRNLAFKKVYDGPGSDKSRPIVINDDDYDDDDDVDDDDEEEELYDPKVGSCMQALRGWDGISRSLTKIHSSCFG